MNRLQRLILIAYCLALAYCFLWVPFHAPISRFSTVSNVYDETPMYGWLWEGPSNATGVQLELATPDKFKILLRASTAS